MPHALAPHIAHRPKTQVIADELRDRRSMTEFDERYGVRCKTGYTWIDRSLTHGPQGLEDRLRRPSTSSRHTPAPGVAALLDSRCRLASWSATKLVAIRSPRHPHWPWPARSTVCDILSRHGLVPQKRQRRALGHPGQPMSHMGAPNDVWRADYKGPFTTGDGRDGYPRTITDGDSRFLSRAKPSRTLFVGMDVHQASSAVASVAKAYGPRWGRSGPLAPASVISTGSSASSTRSASTSSASTKPAPAGLGAIVL